MGCRVISEDFLKLRDRGVFHDGDKVAKEIFELSLSSKCQNAEGERMASFASIVKKERTQLEVHPEHAKAELSALIRMNGSLTLMAHRFVLNIQTENPAIAAAYL